MLQKTARVHERRMKSCKIINEVEVLEFVSMGSGASFLNGGHINYFYYLK